MNRTELAEELLRKYGTLISCDSELRVKFAKEKGIGPGVCCEMFSESLEDRFMEGSSAKIPVITPDNFSMYFQLGRILSHGYILTGYLPLFFAKAFFMSLLPTVCAVDHDVLMESFLRYIDPSEEKL